MNEADEEIAALETVHHACEAGDHDAAAAVLYNRVYRGPDAVISRLRGRHELAMAALLEFYPFRDLAFEPLTTQPQATRWLLHETAATLHVLGRLAEAAAVGGRAVEAAIQLGEQHAACLSMHNLAETHLAAGVLSRCAAVASRAAEISVAIGELEDELVACTLLGTVADLGGDLREAATRFARALEIAEVDTPHPMLFSLSGVRYAEHLMRRGASAEALQAARMNADFCRNQGWIADLALALSQLARWDPNEGLGTATNGIRLARISGGHESLAACLVARSSLLLDMGQNEEARGDINEALAISRAYGLKPIEVQARIASARVRGRTGQDEEAEAEATIAAQFLEQLGLEALRPELERLDFDR